MVPVGVSTMYDLGVWAGRTTVPCVGCSPDVIHTSVSSESGGLHVGGHYLLSASSSKVIHEGPVWG